MSIVINTYQYLYIDQESDDFPTSWRVLKFWRALTQFWALLVQRQERCHGKRALGPDTKCCVNVCQNFCRQTNSRSILFAEGCQNTVWRDQLSIKRLQWDNQIWTLKARTVWVAGQLRAVRKDLVWVIVVPEACTQSSWRGHVQLQMSGHQYPQLSQPCWADYLDSRSWLCFRTMV